MPQKHGGPGFTKVGARNTHGAGRGICHAVAFDIFDERLFQKINAPRIGVLHDRHTFVKGAAGHPWVGMHRRPVANISPDGTEGCLSWGMSTVTAMMFNKSLTPPG